MTVCYLDTETYCETPLKHGLHRYAEDVEITICTWAEDEGPVETWDCTDGSPMPPRLRELLTDQAARLVIQNSGFDRTVIKHAWGITIDPARVDDTMVRALSHGLPGALDKLCVALGVPSDQAKDKAGKALIQLFCKPRAKNMKVRRATRHTHPVEWSRFLSYAGSDILAMRAVARKLPRWNYNIDAQRGNSGITEHALWCLDQRINERGVFVDTHLADAAVAAVEHEQKRLSARTREMTDDEVQSTRQRDALLKHVLAEYGVELPDLRASTLELRVNDPDLPEPLRELLAIRLMASTSSTTKYKALQRGVSSDGRLRGTLQFCGASRTGRWAGRLFQPQNLPRVPRHLKKLIDTGIEAIKNDCVDLVFDSTMEIASAAIRGCIIAPPGKKLVVADLANIEGRVLAWLAGEQWKLDAFANGDDLYILGYSRSFGVREELVVADTESGGTMRLIGKVQELALGYQGAVGAFGSMAKLYGVDLPDERVLQIVKGWRKANSNIVSFWYELEEKAKDAIFSPGTEVRCRKLVLRRDGAWLRIILPSGRNVCYPGVRIDDGKITYMGVNQYSRKWERLRTYGGKLVENVTQAVARDVIADAMPRVEEAGYEIVLTVHDEIISEAVDNSTKTSEELCALMAAQPLWAEGLPLAAAGFEAMRYRKE